MPVCLGCTGWGDGLVRKYIEDSRELWEGHVESVGYSTVGGTLGTHVGPGAVALAFFAKQ